MPKPPSSPTFFPTSEALAAWLEENHDRASELWIGFYKRSSGTPGITYQEALDQALAFGWIDGVRKSLGETEWTIRFSPRKPRSIWSQVNLKRVAELLELGRMRPPGQKAFEERDPRLAQRYSYEEGPRQLDDVYEATLRSHPKAWEFFVAQPPSYRKAANWWVMSAKKEETRQKRLGTLIADSERGKRLKQLLSKPPRDRASSA